MQSVLAVNALQGPYNLPQDELGMVQVKHQAVAIAALEATRRLPAEPLPVTQHGCPHCNKFRQTAYLPRQ